MNLCFLSAVINIHEINGANEYDILCNSGIISATFKSLLMRCERPTNQWNDEKATIHSLRRSVPIFTIDSQWQAECRICIKVHFKVTLDFLLLENLSYLFSLLK